MHSLDKKYYHDPETNKGGFFLENEAPENYVLGNTKETIELKSLKAKNKVLKDSTKLLLSKIKKNIFLMIKGELKEKVNKEDQLNYLLNGWEYSSHRKNFIWMQRNTDNRVLKIPLYLKDDLINIGWKCYDKRKAADKLQSERMKGKRLAKEYVDSHLIGEHNPNFGNRTMIKENNKIRLKQEDHIKYFNNEWRFAKKNKDTDIYISNGIETTYIPEYIFSDLEKNGWKRNDDKKYLKRKMKKDGCSRLIELEHQLEYVLNGWIFTTKHKSDIIMIKEHKTIEVPCVLKNDLLAKGYELHENQKNLDNKLQ